MNRTLWLAAASAIALVSCRAAETDNTAAADVEANTAAGANAMADVNAAAPAQTAAADDYEYGPGPAGLPAGAQLAVLNGDPGKPGPFTIRLRFPAGYSVPAHWHPTAESVTIISGDVSVGMGDKLDRSAAKSLGPGGFIFLPAKMNHYAFTDGGGVLQINAEGPFEVTYVNPADDPRR